MHQRPPLLARRRHAVRLARFVPGTGAQCGGWRVGHRSIVIYASDGTLRPASTGRDLGAELVHADSRDQAQVLDRPLGAQSGSDSLRS
jgi:hypothetical protein